MKNIVLTTLVSIIVHLAYGQERGKAPLMKNRLSVNALHLLNKNVNLAYERQWDNGFALKVEGGYTLTDNAQKVDIYGGVFLPERTGIRYERGKERYLIALMPKYILSTETGRNSFHTGLRLAYANERFTDKCLEHGTISSAASYVMKGAFERHKLKLHLVMGTDIVLKRSEESQWGLHLAGGMGPVFEKRKEDYLKKAGTSFCSDTQGFRRGSDHNAYIRYSAHVDVSLYHRF